MLFTKECDYALRIIKALRNGNKLKVKEVCEREEIPEAFAYKIMKKMEKQGMVQVIRGVNGGCVLLKKVESLCLYDVVTAIDAEFAITHCIKEKCSRDTEHEPCAVRCEMLRIQQVLEKELKAKNLKEILDNRST